MRAFSAITLVMLLTQTDRHKPMVDHVPSKKEDTLNLQALLHDSMSEAVSLFVDRPSKDLTDNLLSSATLTKDAVMPSFRRESMAILDQARLYGRLGRAMTGTGDSYAGLTSKKNGVMADQCDSLLFSGLALYANIIINEHISDFETRQLTDQRLRQDLVDAQDFIHYFSSQDDGAWIRHPRCAKKSISRDMAHGVALVQVALRTLGSRQPFYQKIQKTLDDLTTVNRTSRDGSFMGLFLSPWSRSDLFTSLINPTIVEMLDPGRGIMINDLILVVPEPRGYVTHLNALAILFELESLALDQPPRTLQNMINLPSRIDQLERLLNLARAVEKTSPENILFKAIRFRVTAAIMDTLAAENVDTHEQYDYAVSAVKIFMAMHLINKLSALEARGLFPADRLPNSGKSHRFEEYLWQRSEETWTSPTTDAYEWPGVDYIMMVAMIMALS
jgi:hypothetical protein